MFKFFYNAFSNHVYDSTQTFGDVYRLFKYFFRFQEWDKERGRRLFKIFPCELTPEQLGESNGMFFKKEKNIIKQMVNSFEHSKRVDRVTTHLALDFLQFVRYFTWKNMTAKVAGQNNSDVVSYLNLYNIFIQIGLTP